MIVLGSKPITNKSLLTITGLYACKGDFSLSETIASTIKGSYVISGNIITLTKSGIINPQKYTLSANKGTYKTTTVIFMYHGIYGVTLKTVTFKRGRVLKIKHGH